MDTPQEAFGPAARHAHDHAPLSDVSAAYDGEKTLGQRLADRFTSAAGSWTFVLVQSALLAVYIGLNIYLAVMAARHPGFLGAFDPYPFIFLNLILSFQSALAGPVILMSQNRQTEQDRLAARYDFEVNRRAKEEIKVIIDQLVHQERLALEVLRRLEALQGQQAEYGRAIRQVAERVGAA